MKAIKSFMLLMEGAIQAFFCIWRKKEIYLPSSLQASLKGEKDTNKQGAVHRSALLPFIAMPFLSIPVTGNSSVPKIMGDDALNQTGW